MDLLDAEVILVLLPLPENKALETENDIERLNSHNGKPWNSFTPNAQCPYSVSVNPEWTYPELKPSNATDTDPFPLELLFPDQLVPLPGTTLMTAFAFPGMFTSLLSIF